MDIIDIPYLHKDLFDGAVFFAILYLFQLA